MDCTIFDRAIPQGFSSTKYIFQSGFSAVINGGFSHRRSCPRGQERSPKSAPQHVPTVVFNAKRDSAKNTNANINK